ncbi:MAG: putative chaperone, Hsp70 (DnaK) family [Pseudomonadota bacterium]
MLLQISEPGQSPDPHQRRVAVGIDLGTTHSLVAAVRHGVAECLPDAQGRMLLPSAVRATAQGRVVGHDALAAQVQAVGEVVTSFKRLMGRGLADVPQPERLPYRLLAGQGMVSVDTDHGVFSPVQLSAEVLAVLRQRAEDTFDSTLYGAVITVPAYFDDAQRQATKDAAQLAGINVLRLINEPTAAAIAYGLDEGSEGLYVIFDLGGGTFDVSVLRLQRGLFEVLATAGNTQLGGDDYDMALLDWLISQHQLGASTWDAAQRSAWMRQARRCKEALSEAQPHATMLTPSGEALGQVTINEFAQVTAALTQATLQSVRQALKDAQVSPQDINGVVMVGGSTRMPSVRQAVAQLFGTEPLTNLNPDEVVALGAARQAHQLAGYAGDDNVLLLDVTPLTLGLETMGGVVEPIVPRNSTLPIAKAQEFTTFQDGQTALALHVVQGERDMASDCRSLARFELRGIPPMAAGAARIRVTFTVDADGLLQVEALEQTSGTVARVEVKPSYGLSDDELARMLQDGFNQAQHDKQARALAQAQVDAKRLVQATHSALAQDGALLPEAQRHALQQLANDLAAQAESATDAEALEQAVKQLNHATEDFAAQRMNQTIGQALSGQHVESIK